MKSDHIFWGQPETVFLTLSELAKHSFLIDQLNSEEVIGGDSNFFLWLGKEGPKITKDSKCETKQAMWGKEKPHLLFTLIVKKVIYGLISID